jgi:ActR/RegA family two-component response regulator
MQSTAAKKKILIASSDHNLVDRLQKLVKSIAKDATVFSAADHKEALFKADNAFPHVAIIDINLQKSGGVEVVQKWLDDDKHSEVPIIILTDVPDKEHFVNEVVTGQIQFLSPAEVDSKLDSCLKKALNRSSTEAQQAYKLRTISANEFLFHQDEVAHSVFLVKSGELVAIKKNGDQSTILGKILPGEFVGEMAHINNDVRSASVQATTNCELIEISRDSLDTILMTKPAWAKALIATLSKRLKSTITKG